MHPTGIKLTALAANTAALEPTTSCRHCCAAVALNHITLHMQRHAYSSTARRAGTASRAAAIVALLPLLLVVVVLVVALAASTRDAGSVVVLLVVVVVMAEGVVLPVALLPLVVEPVTVVLPVVGVLEPVVAASTVAIGAELSAGTNASSISWYSAGTTMLLVSWIMDLPALMLPRTIRALLM
ncbi:hypothetical protein COO60DRAFT_181166 [Scenedesmus sp. NREL 46B-D3]|nr:hypothetical protein COO60DRAFT_181166 [Scenedesmus sp. NREL 46B-D3]